MFRAFKDATASRHSARRGTVRSCVFVALLVLTGFAPAQSSKSTRVLRGPEALSRALEMQRQGQLEQAAEYLKMAQAQAATLTPTERQELKRLSEANSAASSARKQAQDLLTQTEVAVKDGQIATARTRCRRLLTLEQSLSVEDQQRLGELCRTLNVSPTGSGGPLMARNKVQQARTLLAQGNLDAAERLAHEADALAKDFAPNEDNPARIIEEVERARRDPKLLLAASRVALKEGDLDRAELLADDAQKRASTFTFPLWGDTPAKVKKEILTARAQAAKKTEVETKPAVEPTQVVKEPVKEKEPSGGMLSPVKNLFSRGKPEKKEQVEEPEPTAKVEPVTSDNFPKAEALVADDDTSEEPAVKQPVRSVKKPVAKKKESSGGFFAPVKNLFSRSKTPKKETTPEQTAKTAATESWKPETSVKVETLKPEVSVKVDVMPVPPAPVPSVPKPSAPAFRKPEETPVAKRPVKTGNTTDEARQLIAAGRSALNQGDFDKASSRAEQARALKPDLAYWEDTPERLIYAIQRARQTAGTGAAKKTEQTAGREPEQKSDPVVRTPESTEQPRTLSEAQALLRDGRRLMADGKFDEASEKAALAHTYKGKFGLFGDTPDKLKNDLVSSRARQNKEESVRVLKDARLALQKGEFDKAQELAFKAEKLHGPYTILELGDRPGNVLSDIQTARQKKTAQEYAQRKTQPKPKQNDAVAVKPEKTEKTPVEEPAVEPQQKQIALQLMAEARNLQKQNKLSEARQKLNEAQAHKASFRADELSPEQMQLQLASVALRRCDYMVQQAVQVASYGQAPPAENYQQAEQQLQQARSLAEDFGQDVAPIEQQLTWVAEMKSRLPGTATAGQGIPGAPLPKDPIAAQIDPSKARGLELLEKSRLEFRKGSLKLARELAEQAYTGQFNVKNEAMARLREIDVEEFNQSKLEASRTFRAAVDAFNRKDFQLSRTMLLGIKSQHLDESCQARARELLSSPEMGGEQTLQADANLGKEEPGAVQRADNRPLKKPLSEDPTAGTASLSDDFEGDLLKAHKALENIRFQAMTDESLKVQREANEKFRAGDAVGAVAMLQEFLLKLPTAQLGGEHQGMLRRPIDSRIQKYNLMAAQADMDRQATGKKSLSADTIKMERALTEANKQKHIASHMKQFNDYYKQGKYREAEMYARMVHEIDPDNPVATAAISVSKNMGRLQETKELKKKKEEWNYGAMKDSDTFGPYTPVEDPLKFDLKRHAQTKDRRPLSNKVGSKGKSMAVREIESKMERPVNLNFTDAPLRQVIDDLRNWQGMNIMPDIQALREANISLERPITIKLEQVSLKSALNILLKQAELTWVIRDEVLQITTKDHAKEKMEQRTFQVTDLVIPVPDYPLQGVYDHAQNLTSAMANGGSPNRGTPQGSTGPGLPGTPVTSSPGSPGQSNGGFASQGSTSGVPGSMNPSNGQMQVTRGGPTNAMPEHLIKLITNAIAPDSWSGMGGTATIDYFPLAMTLVINQTPDIQEQIQDLLQQLRRLQDQSVALEIRLISLSDAFFERMGVDFDLKIVTDRETRRFEPLLTSGQYAPPGYINNFNPSRFVAGLTPAGNFTRDLDIPIRATSFETAKVPFGLASEFAAGATGGMNLGLAFLSDIQVFFFLEAAQGDQRANIMQAPKMTLFNGQTATLSVVNNQFFVTGVRPDFSIPGQPTFFPIVQVFSPGVTITLQAVITGDRRFVRVNVANVALVNLVTPNVALFPITVPVRPVFDGIGAVGEPTLLTIFLQQPTFNVINMQTTVVVPDGGTVLVGGLKRLSEGRTEFGPPVLSKLPWLNRLVKNVGYGRESENILLMVTPRIIITEEEEIVQTGVISNPSLVQ